MALIAWTGAFIMVPHGGEEQRTQGFPHKSLIKGDRVGIYCLRAFS